MLRILSRIFLMLPLAVALCGCSGAPASISGTITTEGQPVTEGTIIFSPIAEDGPLPGRPGMADIRPDGTFSFEIPPGERGLVKRCTVRFNPPTRNVGLENHDTVVIPYVGLIPKQAEVEIKPGPNVIYVELVPAAPN